MHRRAGYRDKYAHCIASCVYALYAFYINTSIGVYSRVLYTVDGGGKERRRHTHARIHVQPQSRRAREKDRGERESSGVVEVDIILYRE